MRIATFEVFSTYFLQALDEVSLGDRGLVIHEMIPGELECVIDQGKIDFGITYLPIAHPNLEHLDDKRAIACDPADVATMTKAVNTTGRQIALIRSDIGASRALAASASHDAPHSD